MILVDTNVILDVLHDDPAWAHWSRDQLVSAGPGNLLINPVIYAELAGAFRSAADLDHVVSELELRFSEIPVPALFLAGQAFRQYRGRGGARSRVLADLLIGAHATVAGIPLLTRNGRDYRRDFPALVLLTP